MRSIGNWENDNRNHESYDGMPPISNVRVPKIKSTTKHS